MALLTTLGILFGTRQQLPEAPRYRPAQVYEIPYTLDIVYRVEEQRPRALEPALDRVESKMSRPDHKGEGYKLRRVGENPIGWSGTRTLRAAIKRLHDVLSSSLVGMKWVIRSVKSKFTMGIKKLDLNPAAVVDTPGTFAIDVVAGTVTARFGEVQDAGICVCKRISGSSTWSQHAYCNAWDITGSTDKLDQIAAYIRNQASKGHVPLAELLWRVPGHYGHIHFTGAPKRSGYPTACG